MNLSKIGVNNGTNGHKYLHSLKRCVNKKNAMKNMNAIQALLKNDGSKLTCVPNFFVEVRILNLPLM